MLPRTITKAAQHRNFKYSKAPRSILPQSKGFGAYKLYQEFGENKKNQTPEHFTCLHQQRRTHEMLLGTISHTLTWWHSLTSSIGQPVHLYFYLQGIFFSKIPHPYASRFSLVTSNVLFTTTMFSLSLNIQITRIWTNAFISLAQDTDNHYELPNQEGNSHYTI